MQRAFVRQRMAIIVSSMKIRNGGKDEDVTSQRDLHTPPRPRLLFPLHPWALQYRTPQEWKRW